MPHRSLNSPIRLVSRGSELALLQVAMVGARLRIAYDALGFGRPDLTIETSRTIGDQSREEWAARALGLDADTRGRKWSLEVERGVAEGRFDLAVHSGKDLPNQPYPGTVYLPVLEREDPCDVFIPQEQGRRLSDLGQHAVIGTNSARRRAALRALRPDLQFADYAGNVPTRLSSAQMAAKRVDGAVMAAAGLKRLRLFDAGRMEPLPPTEMLPSATQGIVAAQIREDAAPELRAAIEALQHPPTMLAWEAERAFLGMFGVGCETPIAAYCETRSDPSGLINAHLWASAPQKEGPPAGFAADLSWVRAEPSDEMRRRACALGEDLARQAIKHGARAGLATPEDFPSVES